MSFLDRKYIDDLTAGRSVLDIGCGLNKYPGSVGVDVVDVNEVDVRHDLDSFPYPIESDSFDVILLRNVIEHIHDVVGLMEEIHRVASNGADLLISTPHFSSLYSYQDPTHVRHMALDSMDYFVEDTDHSNFYSSVRYMMVKKDIDFGRSIPLSYMSRILFIMSARKYEKHFSFILPANQLHYHLRVVK